MVAAARRWMVRSLVVASCAWGGLAYAQTTLGVTYAPLGDGIVDAYVGVTLWSGDEPLPLQVGVRADVASALPLGALPSVSLGVQGAAELTTGLWFRLGSGAVLGWGRSAEDVTPFVAWNAWTGVALDVAEGVALVVEGGATPLLGAYGFSVGAEIRR